MRALPVILLLFLFLATLNGQAQKILVFDRDGHAKRIRFRIHDRIEVRTSEASLWREGEITDMQDSTLTIGDDVIVVSKINAIKYDTKSSGWQLLRGVTSVLPFAGLGLLAISAINAVINDSYPVYSKNTLILSGAFIASKPIVYFLTYHKHIINEHHRLKIIDVSIR